MHTKYDAEQHTWGLTITIFWYILDIAQAMYCLMSFLVDTGAIQSLAAQAIAGSMIDSFIHCFLQSVSRTAVAK